MKNLSALVERIRDRREQADIVGIVLGTLLGLVVILIVGSIIFFIVKESTEPKEGTVTSTEYHPPYTTTTMQCGAYNSNGTCTYYYPVVHHHPARWEINYEDSEGNQGDDDVSEAEFETIEVGDYYVND